MAPHSSLPSSSKKRKTRDEDSTVLTIQQLETQLINAVSSGSSLNPLADLLDVALNAKEIPHLSKAIYSLYRVFVTIITRGLLYGNGDDTKTVRTWLVERLQSYVDLLTSLLQDEETALKASALEILFSLQKHLSTALPRSDKNQPQFHATHFRKIVNALLVCPPSLRSSRSKKRKEDEGSGTAGVLDADVRNQFIDTWLSVYDDIRWFFLRDAATFLANYSFQVSPHVPGNLLSILERLTTFPTKASELNAWWVEELGTRPPTKKHSDPEDEPVEHDADVPSETEDDWRKFFEDQPTDTEQTPVGGGPRLHTMTIHQSLHSLASHKAIFTRAWLGLLPQLSLDTGESNRALSLRVLNVLHRGVLPHLTRPILVMDWVSSAVDHGGTVGLLALNALFVLMKEYNLDYPSFYTRLYGFLDRNVLHLKHRARFFRLTELFLSSTHLPAILVASFVKRLARLSLNAPPAAVVMIMPFTYNILRTHPSLMCMIHRDDDLLDVHCDAFLVNEPNPNLTKALDSSLWELYTHKIHFHAAVSTLARIFEEAFTRPQYNMEDFLDHTYGTMFETETKHKIRKDPVVVEEPSHEFTHDQFWMYS